MTDHNELCDIYHIFLGGIIVGDHVEEKHGTISTKLTIWQTSSQKFQEIILPFYITEIASMHMHSLVFGTRGNSEDEICAVFNLAEAEIVHQICPTSDPFVRSIRQQEPVSVTSKKGKGRKSFPVMFSYNKMNKRIAATETDTFLVDNNKKVIYRLLNDQNYLDRTFKRGKYKRQDDREDDRHIVEEVFLLTDLLEEEETISQIAAGGAHVTILTTAGRVFSWGCNTMGQLGVTGRMKTTNFTLIEAFEIGIAKIASGTWHNLALTDNREVMVWGRNNKGQLGPDFTEFNTIPTILNLTDQEDEVPLAQKPIDIWANHYGSVVFMAESKETPLEDINHIHFGETSINEEQYI